MPVCPLPARKYTAFGRPALARGLHANRAMQKQFLFLATFIGTLSALMPSTFAQAVDSISAINDQTFENNAQLRYFNRTDCGLDPEQGTGGTGGTGGVGGDGGTGGVGGDGGTGGVGGGGGATAATVLKAGPEDTTFEIRLENSGLAISQVYLWAGSGGAECEKLNQRQLGDLSLCAEIAGNPRPVGTNFLIENLTLQDLLDADAGTNDVVQCDSSGLTGTPYKIFAFRDQPPSGDVLATGYGVADFFVDVESPAAPTVNTSPQEASTFSISWGNPNPPDEINAWRAWYSDSSDPSTATATNLFEPLSARSISISPSQVGLTQPGETAFVFMQAYDQAIISNDTTEQALAGNQSELSAAVQVTFVDTVGFCQGTGECSGCSAAPMNLAAPRGPANLLWILGLLAAVTLVWRRRR